MPHFAPVRVRDGLLRSGRLVRHRRRAAAVGLAVTAVALVAAGPRETDRSRGHPDGASGTRVTSASAASADGSAGNRAAGTRRAGDRVTAPVRIADAATVRLLRPGDRVDVIAAGERGTGGAAGGAARVVARGARVVEVPEPPEIPDAGGALVVLSVPRATAAELAGASTTARLAVTLG
ncbi:RcpC/CpaB family pilus assembly protein [Streptomyces sp. NPDC058442]|uniref:RcpC/CpaB family pilus assembly protein n=1 Tax=Streptomyces sp. NPDC058442 TaxID=3346503 RepID=UPI00364DA375